MAQIIKHRRGSLENLSSVTGSLQKGELVFATGSSNLTLTNGTALAFIVPESGSAVAANRFLRGANNPNVFSGSTYNGLLNGVPYYASGSSTLYLLGSDVNEAINLVGNIQPFSQSVDSRLDSLESSIGGGGTGIGSRVDALEASQSYFDGTYSGSVATRFSASVASVTANSASAASALDTLSGSIATTNNTQSDNITIASQAAAGAFASASAYSGSAATSFSASLASQTALSASLATTNNTQTDNITIATQAAAGAFASASAYSGSLATSISASKAEYTAFSASNAVTDNTQTTNITAATNAAAGAFASASAYSGSAATALNTYSSSAYSTFAKLSGGNTFNGTQTITGSLYVSADLIVQGSSSLQNITASAVTIGTNIVVLNTANPAVRFGGIKVIDSGSSQATGSLLWDSQNNVWLYQNPDGAAYTSAKFIAGPKNTGSLGDEQGLTVGYVPVAVGDDHIGNSIISASSTIVNIAGGLTVTGNVSASTISGIGNVSGYSQSVDTRLATVESSIGGGGSLGTRVANLETISASYLAFTSSYYTTSGSVGTQITTNTQAAAGAFASASAYSGSFYTTINTLSGSIATTNNTQTDNITIATQAAAGAFASASAYSGSAATSFSASLASQTALSASIATTNNTQTDNITIATQAAAGAFASASAYSGSAATSFSASLASQNALSASLATLNNTQTDNITIATQAAAGAFASASAYSGSAASALNTLSGSIATTNNTQTDNITIATQAAAGAFASASAYSGSAATALNTLSGSVYTQFSASAAGETALSSSLAGRVVTLEGSGSIQAVGTKNNVTFNSLTTTNDVTIGGNLIVQGDTVSLNTGQLYVEDKLITLASGSTSSTTSDGAGIEIAGANASLKYVHTSTSFSSSVNVIAPAVTASLNVPGGSSTKRLAFRGLTDNIEFIAAPTTAGDIAQWNGTDFVMSNTIDGGSF